MVGRDLEEINGQFDRHRGEINHLKIREKDSKQEVEQLKGFIVGAGHEAQIFKNRLDRMEENVCRCGRTPSEVGEEFVSSEDEGRTELSYACVREDEYVAPSVENTIPLPVPALSTSCLGPITTLPPMEEISEEPAFICEDLDGLLREANEGRARDLQEESSNLVVHVMAVFITRFHKFRFQLIFLIIPLSLLFSHFLFLQPLDFTLVTHETLVY